MSLTFKTLIIEDESLARIRLKKLLAPFVERIHIVGEADNGEDGAKLIDEHKPDLIFLDVQMPVLNGFEMLDKISHIPKIIFTTAFEEYAIKAFEENSIDYLLKPISAARLEVSILKLERFTVREKPDQNEELIQSLLKSIASEKKIATLSVKTGDRIFLVHLDDVIYLEAKEKYVFIHDTSGKEHLIDFTLTALVGKLPSNFMRIHRSYIINKDFLVEMHKGFTSRFTFVLNNKGRTRLSSGSSYNKAIRLAFDF